MKILLSFEELALFLLSVYAFAQLPYAWWLFPALLFLPDVSMLGYLAGNKIGAACYNLFHHKAPGIACFLAGLTTAIPGLQLAGVILFAHSCFDRVLGYGLKYPDSFQHTHLGMIGRKPATAPSPGNREKDLV